MVIESEMLNACTYQHNTDIFKFAIETLNYNCTNLIIQFYLNKYNKVEDGQTIGDKSVYMHILIM